MIHYRYLFGKYAVIHSVHYWAQPGIAADRCAREIVRILKVRPSALAAAERQAVGR